MSKRLVTDLGENELKGKRVFVRVDFNAPQDESTREITSDKKIEAAFETISYLIENGAKVVLCSHLSRPVGIQEKYDMKYVAKVVEQKLKTRFPDTKFNLTDEIILNDNHEVLDSMNNGDVTLLQNVRFNKGEEKNDPELSKRLASIADVYVNDAFGTAHREHCSTSGIIDFLGKDVPKVAGCLVARELEYLGDTLLNPKRPFVIIFGGLKVSDKIKTMRSLVDKLEKGDSLIIGGAMAYTFLAAQGIDVGSSLVEEEQKKDALEILEIAKKKHFKVLLPLDHEIVTDLKNPGSLKETKNQEIEKGYMGIDIGPKTIELYSKAISKANTVFWNGPMGAFETPQYAKGTFAIAQGVAKLMRKRNARSVIGGGDSEKAAKAAGVTKDISHISTGGGATMEFIECNGKFATMEKLDDAPEKEFDKGHKRRPFWPCVKDKLLKKYNELTKKR